MDKGRMTMAGTIPYLRWREGLCSTVPDEARIGEDLFLIRNPERKYLVSGPFRLDLTISVFLSRGSCRFMADMSGHTVSAPCMFTVSAGQIFQMIWTSDDMETCTVLMSGHFTEEMFIGMKGTEQLLDSVVRHPVIDLSGCISTFEEYLLMLEDLLSSPLNRFKAEAARHLTLAMFYGYSYRFHEICEDKKETAGESLLRRFIVVLKRHYRTQRSVSFYASELCVTPKYLSRAVRRLTGKTALEYIDTYVTTECKALLLSTEMTVQQISDSFCFPSQSVFGKYFKRNAGVSPREYRKRANATL